MDKGRLYLVGTPIGNLDDMTYRAVETLKNSHIILCEDTRHSGRLLKHFGIDSRLLSYHKYNEAERSEEVIAYLKEGLTVSQISDAGMPSISDPGSVLVNRVHEEGLEVYVVPGPSASVSALALSGFGSKNFQFLGFLARKKGEKRKELDQTINYPGSTIIYESPKRVLDTLELIREVSPKRRILLARELTKLNEESLVGSVEEIIDQVKDGVKGEIVLVLDEYEEKEEVDLEEDLKRRLSSGMSPSRAAKDLARDLGISKNEIYDLAVALSKEG